MIPFKYILIIRTNFGYLFTLLDLHIVRWKKLDTSIKLRKKEIFEDGWGILDYEHVVQWELIDILALKKIVSKKTSM